MGARRWLSAQRLHGRGQYSDCDRLRATAHGGLCDPGPAGDVAGRPAVGTWRLCGVYCGARPRPAARIAGHTSGRTGGTADLVDRHGCCNSHWALPVGLPPRSMGCGTWPRSDRAAASDRRAPGAGIQQRGSGRAVAQVHRGGNAHWPAVLVFARRLHQRRVRTYLATVSIEVDSFGVSTFDALIRRSPGAPLGHLVRRRNAAVENTARQQRSAAAGRTGLVGRRRSFNEPAQYQFTLTRWPTVRSQTCGGLENATPMRFSLRQTI